MRFYQAIVLSALLLSATTFAHENIFSHVRVNDPFADGANDIYSANTNSSFFVSVGGGVDALSFGDRVNVLVNNTVGNPSDVFQTNNEKDIGAIALAQIGWQWVFDVSTQPILKLALEYDYLTNSTAQGTRQDLNFSTSNFTYNIKRQALLLVGKLNIFHSDTLLPYIEGGAGVARVTFSNFENPSAPSEMQPFPNKTSTNFAAILGLGFDMKFSEHFLMSIGYRFAYWNTITSGDATVSPGNGNLPQPIHLSNELYSNEGLMSLSYLI